MALRSGHGKGRGRPHVEVLPADELPAGIPAPPSPPVERRQDGTLLPGPGAQAIARLGAQASADARRLGRLLGLWQPEESHEYAPYARLAREWRDERMAEIARDIGGGVVGAGTAAIVASSALQMGASRYLHDQGAMAGDASMLLKASGLSDAARQNILAAHELAAKEAAARGKRADDTPAWEAAE